MTFQLRIFQGACPALFNFNTSGQTGGYADVDNYAVDEPRARGIGRQIPMGSRAVPDRSPQLQLDGCRLAKAANVSNGKLLTGLEYTTLVVYSCGIQLK